jgi:UDP-N-acetylglucosamine 2-epimerase (non-hydrolysing)
MAQKVKTLFIVFGTRPEAIKLVPLIRALEKDGDFTLKLCVTAQHREMLDSVLDEFGIHPQFDLSLMREDQTLDYITAEILKAVADLLDLCSPDAMIVQGDTTTAFASSLAAFYRKIPVIHIEAGLISGNLLSPFPEEFNRRTISAISSYHFSPTEAATSALISEGVPRKRIYTVGNTVIDTLKLTEGGRIDYKIDKFIKERRYLLITLHRREHTEHELDEILEGIKNLLLDNPDICAIYPVHKSPRVAERAHKVLGDLENLMLCEPLSTTCFHSLLRGCYMILTDSGGIQEEATFLGKPTLILRNETERGEGVSSGALRLVGTDGDDIYAAATILLHDKKEYAAMARRSDIYGDGAASERIVKALRSL